MTKLELDQYEQDIEDNFERHRIINDKDYMSQLRKAAIEHQKKQSITIRITNNDLDKIKLKASKKGMEYQSYINMVIHKAATKL